MTTTTNTAPAPVSAAPEIRALLNAARTESNRCELSEIGIGYLRDYAASMGWSRDTLSTFIYECGRVARAHGCTPDVDGLRTYNQARRQGERAPFRATIRAPRAARVAAFAQIVGRGVI